MIQEICNFVKEIPLEYHTSNIKPSNGLHIIIDLDEEGNPLADTYQSTRIDKKSDPESIWIDIANKEYYSNYITANKFMDLGGEGIKKIHSSTFYSIWFKKENIEGKINVSHRIPIYYENLRQLKGVTKDEIEQSEKIEEFAKHQLLQLINADEKLPEIADKEYIKIYFNAAQEDCAKAFNRYLSNKLFLKDKYNVLDDSYGLSDFFNNDGDKKPFLKHLTTNFLVNNRQEKGNLALLFQFKKLLQNRKLPNPLPLFIDKEELNTKMVTIYKEDNTNGFREILKKLYEEHKGDLGNYYLINWANSKDGLMINDIDFVSSFQFELEEFYINDYFKINDGASIRINNVFSFEIDLGVKLFANALIVKTKKDGVIFKYFDEVNPKYTTKNNYQNVLTHRKAFYDFIYKSKPEALNHKIIQKLCLTGIKDDIKNNSDFKYTNSMKEKLNVLFSINHKFGGEDMSSEIPVFVENLREIITCEDKHCNNDKLFAFAAGQLIYYMLCQSESSNKTHSLIEPFISKTSPEQFKLAITRGIATYKHAFRFGFKKFEKLAGEVLAYNCETSIKDLQPQLLAGYFYTNLLFEKN